MNRYEFGGFVAFMLTIILLFLGKLFYTCVKFKL